jgi:hypothetical protein
MPILDCGDLIEKETVHILTIDSVAYDPEEKMTSKTYQTCYVYADDLFIGKVYGSSNKPCHRSTRKKGISI